MKRSLAGVLVLLVALTCVAVAQQPASTPITVDCNKGQSLNHTLAILNKQTAYTVSVNGTCTEWVQVVGFHSLLLKGLPGATLVQPSTGGGNLFNATLYIEASQSVLVEGFAVQASADGLSDIGIGHGSSDIRLRSLNIRGGGGIVIFENSQVSIAHVHVRDTGYASLQIYDSSDVHVEHCLFEDTTNGQNQWHVGIALGAAHVTMYATTIRNMQQGINGGTDSIVDLVVSNAYYVATGNTDVVIDSSGGFNFASVAITGGSLNIYNSTLVVNRSGQSWGGTTAGVLLDGGASFYAASGELRITNSLGQGIVAMNNSHATLFGANITYGTHAGLVAINNSSIDLSTNNTPPSTIGGNAVDLFCDADSKITGTANIAGSPTAQCANLLSTETVPLP
ncbi:MAG TPA: right-handed parallel beta-helix repeat-containing protein [Candidatus Sulfotelmatobacter sp.]|nr:right-handed parallel beta-helix repeat-containing protein [Candidatus Sulfotelmatobacter sp.]